MKRTFAKWLGLILLLALAQSRAIAQDLEFHVPASAADAATPAAMRDLAERILPVYQEADQSRYLSNLSALQLVAGDPASAYASRQSLHERRAKSDAGRPIGRSVLYDIYAHARAIEAKDHVPFAQAFTQAYRETVPKLGDLDTYMVTRWFGTPLAVLQDTLQKSFDQRRARNSITLPDAIDLIWTYLSFDAYRSFAPLVSSLDSEEDRRRYAAEDGVLIKTPDGATLEVVLVRPKTLSKRLPALLEVTPYVTQNYTKESAAHGYVGVVAYTRGKGGSPDKVVPYQHDGDDARAVINWIAKQPWSDGRVGMYGSGVNGFTAWAAAKRLPPALKAIATSDATVPGVDMPMRGNIFQNWAYRWLFDQTNPKTADAKVTLDDARWRSLEEDWYRSGRRYREFPSVPGPQNALFRRWLNHPSYDRFWQKMVPYREDFAHINIPVLTTTGYYAGGAAGALYYFSQHYRNNPRANHTLLIGPYDEGAIHGPAAMLNGYAVDPVALIDIREVRYQWFDAVFKGGKKPEILKSRVNYQVMGTNEWRHGASLDALSNAPLRFYLQAAEPPADRHVLARKGSESAFLLQTLSLADRTDAGWMPSADLVSKSLPLHNAVAFVSEPLQSATQVSGLLSGRLDFTVNKMDMDLNVTLYELLPSGDYVRLAEPYEFRASYVRDRVHRHLLRAGERQQLTFRSEYLTSRKLQAGSRVVLVLGLNKRPDQQINYGAGDDVSEESIDDAAVPVKVRWYGSSYVELPTRR